MASPLEPPADRRGAAPLRCPHCGGDLERDGRTFRCASGHAFDVARQGYVNLLPGPARHPGDDAAMLAARAAVLAAGHLAAVTDVLVEESASAPPGTVVEVGAGTAHHLAAVVAATGRAGVAMDVSKHAARRAARTGTAITSVVADAWQDWPLRDASAGAVLHVFAPRNLPEAHRVLRPGGALLLVVPRPEHLQQLRERLGSIAVGDPGRKQPDHPGFVLRGRRLVRDERRPTRDEARALVAMGPSAHHLDAAEVAARAAALPETLPVTVSVEVLRLERRADGASAVPRAGTRHAPDGQAP